MKRILVGMATAVLFSPAAFAAPTLTLDGECPGDTAMEISGATPNTWVGLFRGSEGGTHTFGGGPCGGTSLDLGDAFFAGKIRTDKDGNASRTRTLDVWQCGDSLQAIDLGDCSVSETARNPAPMMEPEYIGFEWWGGYNANSDTVTSVSVGADSYNPMVVLNIYDVTFTKWCQVWYEFSTADMASWRDSSGAMIGFDVPADAEVDSSCGTYNGASLDWDRDVWGDNPADAFAGSGWQIGIQHMLADGFTDSLQDAYTDAGIDWAADVEPYILGGGLYQDPGVENSSYGYGYEVDSASMELGVDKSGYMISMTVSDLDLDATAYYDFYEWYVWSGFFDFSYTIADVQPIFDKHCVSCHSGKVASGSMDLSSGNAHANTVNVLSSTGMLLVADTGVPDESYLWHKLIGTHMKVGGAGDQMPRGAAPLSSDDLDVIEYWLLDGALP